MVTCLCVHVPLLLQSFTGLLALTISLPHMSLIPNAGNHVRDRLGITDVEVGLSFLSSEMLSVPSVRMSCYEQTPTNPDLGSFGLSREWGSPDLDGRASFWAGTPHNDGFLSHTQ